MGGPEGRGQRVSKLGSFDRDIPGWNTATVSNMRMGGEPLRRPGPARPGRPSPRTESPTPPDRVAALPDATARRDDATYGGRWRSSRSKRTT